MLKVQFIAARRIQLSAARWTSSALVGALLLACGALAQPPETPLALTDAERAWVNAHPVIRAAATPDWPPFDMVGPDGEHRGINPDLLRRLAEMAGLQVESTTGPWPELYEKLRNRELDVCAGMQASDERRAHLRFTDPVFRFPHAIYTHPAAQGLDRIDALAGKRVSVEREYYEHEYLRDNHPEIELVPVDNALQALLAVSRGDADAYIGNVAVASYLITENMLPDVQMGNYADLGQLELSIGVRADYAPLVGILNKALAALPAAEKRAIVDRYIATRETIALTEAEHAWLREHPVIRLGIDPEFAPFEYLDENGSYSGMTSDYIRLLNERLGINLEVVHTTGWDEAVSLAREGGLDVLPCVGRNQDRENFLVFSEPYLQFHRVIVTRLDSPFVGGLDDLTGFRVATQENSSHHGFITDQTELEPVLYKTFREALAAVAQGKADCAIGNVATTAYWIERLGLSNLRLAVPVGHGVEQLHFGVRKDWPELAAILDKGLASFSEEEILDIRRKWIGVEVPPGVDTRRLMLLVLGVIAVFLPILGLVTFHNRRLHKEIAARLETEAALRESEGNYRTLVENANSIILRMTPDGTIRFLNRYGMEFFGYTADEIVGASILETIVPETDSIGRNLVGRMERLGKHPEHFTVSENENITRDGRRVWIAWTNCPLYDAGGALQEILCVGNDVTAQRRIADTLRRYEFIVNTVRSMMSVIDSEGRYEAVNDAWCAATGVARADAVGQTVADIWGAGVSVAAILPHLHACLSGTRVNYEATITLPAVGERICDVTFYPFTDTYDHRPRAIVVAHDVTERKAAERKLEDAMRAAEAGNRAKSAFLANMSHEIRTPMNAVLGYTQLLQRIPDLPPDQKHALEAIRRSGDHLLSLITDILELSRIEAGHVTLDLTTFGLAHMLQDLDMMFRVRTDARGVNLMLEMDSDLPPFIRGDLSRIKQVLINLVGNAIKFTETGHIRIHARSGEAPAGGTAPAPFPPRLMLRFDVEDTGCGIATEELDSVFGSFEQASATAGSQEGAGLGLAISRNFARLMGGDVTVRATPGEGSCFTFTLAVEPGREEDVANAAPARHVQSLAHTDRGCRVLIVDDRETNRDLLCRMLSTLGFETREARNGLEGTEIYREWKPRVVLVDLVMPVMDGREAIRQMRAHPLEGVWPPCIVALTASTLPEERDAVLALGADAFLRKPFREDELLEAIRIHGRVEYTYTDDTRVSADNTAEMSMAEARIATAALPRELSDALRSAVTRGAINESNAIMPRLREANLRLAQFVQHYLEAYILDELCSLWQGEQKI